MTDATTPTADPTGPDEHPDAVFSDETLAGLGALPVSAMLDQVERALRRDSDNRAEVARVYAEWQRLDPATPEATSLYRLYSHHRQMAALSAAEANVAATLAVFAAVDRLTELVKTIMPLAATR